ncbi:cytochrome P450 52A12 protein [Rutstroemia sp. NJR-2017a BBW]|nr:cytochrome P450 52A12 protein [Rutstroemia sp. NJR-2017a BBW]
MSFGSMHIDPTIWGPDAKLYRPERWEGRKQDWNYIPFLGGRRICPAQQNVLTDVTIGIRVLSSCLLKSLPKRAGMELR